MKCKECKKEYDEKDFLMGSTTCYKCVYSEKLKKITLKKSKVKRCKYCNCEIPKSRWAYCSDECLQTYSDNSRRNYWTIKFKSIQL